MSVNAMRKLQAVCSVPVRATQKKLKVSLGTGIFWVVFIFLILLAEAYLTSMFTEINLTSVLIFLILVIVIGYFWAFRKKILKGMPVKA